MQARRQMWLSSIFSLLVILANSDLLTGEALFRAWRAWTQGARDAVATPLLHFIGRVGAIVVVACFIAQVLGPGFPPRPLPPEYPRGMSQYLLTKAPPGRIFNDYEYSAALEWLLQGKRKLYVDLINAYPPQLLFEYLKISGATKEGLKLLDERKFDIVALRPRDPKEGMANLANYLNKSLAWRRVYDERDGTIWLRNEPFNAPLTPIPIGQIAPIGAPTPSATAGRPFLRRGCAAKPLSEWEHLARAKPLKLRLMPREGKFKMEAPFPPKGDQPAAIAELVQGARDGLAHQVLLGATGTGKTFTASYVIQELQRPALIIAHNKTLAAQLCQEIREFFPHNAVEYFVSYYDYYQPEAYVPHSDTFIEKESSRNDEIDRLRHSSTQSLTSRRDVIVVSSVSCIYGLGTPELYKNFSLDLRVGDTIDRRGILERLVAMQFARNDVNLVRGTFRVRGDVLEVHPRDSDNIVRVDTFGDEIESIQMVNSVTQNVVEKRTFTTIFPATHFIADEDRMEGALVQIEHDLDAQSAHLESQGKLLEAQRLRQRVRYDMEMMREVGYCNGIENYSRYLDGRKPGDPPYTLIDYFPDDFLLMIDESHQTIPQIRAMYNGDRARKETLVDYGFRLPSAFDNRPLRFEEFEHRMPQTTYVSATPGPYELEHIGLERVKDEAGNAVTNKGSALGSFVMPPDGFAGLAQQIIRPTGLLDPEIFVRPSRGQIDDLLNEIRARTAVGQRVLATTLTKRMAEDLTDYLKEIDVKVNYLHSDVSTMERSQILRELRQGKYDVVVGINLLREGLDLPEVSLVAILDADKEGFLRSETSLIQTIGRAARHVNGQVVMYADRVTGSMQRAIDETNRRRALQIQYNEDNGITPQGIQKAIREDLITELLADVQAEMQPGKLSKKPKMEDLPKLLEDLEAEMKAAAGALDFERAAQLRDELLTLRELAKG